MKRQQILFTEPKIAQLIELDLLPIMEDEILVKMEYTVISGGTERANILSMSNTSQAFPKSLGYCGVGVVEKVGSDVKTFKTADHVLVYHGCHSNYNICKEKQLTKVANNSIPSIEAAFVIIAAMGLGGVRKLEIEIGESAMVMGQGLLGIFSTQFCHLNGAYPVIAVDLNKERRDLALSLGADYALDPSKPDFINNVKKITGGKGISACVEVTGNMHATLQALDAAAYMGRISLLGCTRVSNGSVDYYQQVHRPGIKLIGAHNFVRPKVESYPHHWTHQDDCHAILDLIAAKRIQVAPIISRIVSPKDAAQIYTELCEDINFPVGTVFDWSKVSTTL